MQSWLEDGLACILLKLFYLFKIIILLKLESLNLNDLFI